jgi:hypothetical protein
LTVSLEKSLQIANAMLAAHSLTNDIHLEEGSGISRNDRFTARGLAKVLELFAPHADLLRGHDGGMNKSGTMEGPRTPRRLCRHLKSREGPFCDFARERRRQDAFPAAARY